MKAPKAARSDGRMSRIFRYSPTKAPMKGQNTTPSSPCGPKGSPNSDTTNPMLHPQMPYFDPPNRLVLIDGTT